MKRGNTGAGFLKYGTVLIAAAVLHSLVLIAQDKKIDIDIGIDREPVWYQQPWVWVVGAAVFILLLVAVLRGSRKR